MRSPTFSFNKAIKEYPGSSLMTLLFLVGIVVIAFTVTGCSVPDSPEPEPESAPAETEEIESIDPQEDEAIVIVDPESTLAIRESAGTQDKPEDDVLDRVPEGRVLIIVDKHEDSLTKDGYTWWEVEDTVTGISGWSAAEFLEEK